MSAYADLAKLLLVLALAVGLALFGRSCGKAAGLEEGATERAELRADLSSAELQVRQCASAVGLANNIADQAAAEAIRQSDIAAQAERRAEQDAATAATRIAQLDRQLKDARRNPGAAEQLDIVLHPSIPLR